MKKYLHIVNERKRGWGLGELESRAIESKLILAINAIGNSSHTWMKKPLKTSGWKTSGTK